VQQVQVVFSSEDCFFHLKTLCSIANKLMLIRFFTFRLAVKRKKASKH
jgi:hypothetical protein